jgi:ATP-dependent RNA helicase DHX37/DHR1
MSCPWKFQNGIIGVTQPRRVAAVSLATRVSQELNAEVGTTVGYQIRFDNTTVTAATRIKYMTDGILMKEIETDFLLTKYACVMVDEAHERSLNSDILVALLTRIAHARCELALKERQSKQHLIT